jgi:hypothetical protein
MACWTAESGTNRQARSPTPRQASAPTGSAINNTAQPARASSNPRPDRANSLENLLFI